MNYEYLHGNYKVLIEDIKRICVKNNRDFNDLTLVAVSKTFPSEMVTEVFKEGHLDFGENKVQELKQKYGELKELPVKWHLIGHLQSNKVKYIVDFVHLIHSVDSIKLANEIDLHAKKINRIIDILVQVNTSNEDQKSGIEPADAKDLCEEISKLENVNLKGLMTIGIFTDEEEIIRENFRTLRNLFGELKPVHNNLKYLSMGMTSDYEIAIEEGANMLRIGSAIFGNRNYQ
ncbi:MAG TPA: YggS family pyridoxal phosphate-dependent enzyme [Ignavibacteria bacterium]